MSWKDKVYEAKYRLDYYHANKERIDARTAKADKQRIVRYNQWRAEYLSTHPCVDCDYTDVRALEFDHVRDKKTLSISQMKKHGMKRILEEVAKCEVRCANCHRIVTYERLRGISVAD